MRQNLFSFAISIAAAVIFGLTLKYTGLSDVEATVSLLQIIWITVAYAAISYIIKILTDRKKQAI